MARRVIRLKEVMVQTGLSRSTIFALQKQGISPQSTKIGPRASAWYEHEVQHYIKTRPRLGAGQPKR